MLGSEAREAALRIVRESLRATLAGEDYTPEDPGLSELHAKGGCFVTLKTDGRLRGCLGCFTSNEPLYRTLARMTRDSATSDPRFALDRLTVQDLPDIELEISVLSPLEPTDQPIQIELGKHGIYVQAGPRSGCFLPQVATETGWTVEEFWSFCCSHKAGLPADAWRTGQAKCYLFTAEVIEAPAEPDS